MNMQLHQYTTTISTDILECGLCADTRIMTPQGALPVAHLGLGDMIITDDNGPVAIKDMQSAHGIIRPFQIKANSIGTHDDIYVTSGTQLVIRDWRAKALFGTDTAIVQASQLHDHQFIARSAARDMQIFQLTFDTPQTITANGIAIHIP